jgi:hypothetical protein
MVGLPSRLYGFSEPLHLQQTTNDKLPENLDSDKDPGSLVSAAYIAMRKNDVPAVLCLPKRESTCHQRFIIISLVIQPFGFFPKTNR